MKIRYKLLLNTGAFLLTLLIIFVVFYASEKNIEQFHKAKTLAHEQTANMLSLRRHEKDFLARRDVSYQEKFSTTLQHLQSIQIELQDIMTIQNIDTNILNSLNDRFLAYKEKFNDVVAANITLGLTPSTGLTGELRKAVHGIEKELSAQNKDALLVIMLQLRRAEKDFMLRSDPKYIEKFQGLINKLNLSIKEEKISTSTNDQLLALTNEYQAKFNHYAEESQHIGLTSKEGLLLKMRQEVQATETELASLIKVIDTEIDQRLTADFYFLIATFIFMTTLCIIVTLLMNRSIISPLLAIQTAMNKMHESQDISSRLTSPNDDEIRQVADSINTFLTDVQNALKNVWLAADNVSDTSKKLSETSQKTTENVEKQHQEIQVVSASMEAMIEVVDGISSNMESVTSMSLATKNDAEQGKTKVDSAITSITRLSDRLDGAVSTVDELAKESENIGSVLGVIQGIAEQTNLLALNAAIEAARAGEQGRGFAVVADEVRTLASRTHDATVEISEIIETLQQRTKNIVELVGDCREDGITSRTDAELIKGVLDNIISLVVDVSDMSSNVFSSLEEQRIATGKVSNSIDSIKLITEETSDAMISSNQLSKEVSLQSETLHTALSASKNNTD